MSVRYIIYFGPYLFLKHILAHFSNPKFILTSLLIAFTIFISFSKSSSLLPTSFQSSIYNKWLISLSVLCTGYPQSTLFSSFVNGIGAIQKSNGEVKGYLEYCSSYLNGLGLHYFRFCFKLSLIFHFSIFPQIIYNFIVFSYHLYWRFYTVMWNAFKFFLVINPDYI